MLFKVNLRETGRWLCARRSITGPLGGMKNGKGVLAGVGVIEQRRNDLIYDNWRFSSRWCCPLFPVDFHIIILIWLERRAKSRRIWISHRLDFRGRHLFTFYSAVEWKALCMLFTWNVSDRQWSASWLELIPTFFFFFRPSKWIPLTRIKILFHATRSVDNLWLKTCWSAENFLFRCWIVGNNI